MVGKCIVLAIDKLAGLFMTVASNRKPERGRCFRDQVGQGLLRALFTGLRRRFPGVGHNDASEDHRNRDGVVSHVGSRLLADVADRTTLTSELSDSLAGLRKPRSRHDPLGC
jgi:hypothetical protein